MFFTALAGGAGVSWLPVLMEKLKVEPMVREKVKAWTWLASVWQDPDTWRPRGFRFPQRSFSIQI